MDDIVILTVDETHRVESAARRLVHDVVVLTLGKAISKSEIDRVARDVLNAIPQWRDNNHL